MQPTFQRQTARLLGLAAIAAFAASLALPGIAAARADRVTICHLTGSTTTPVVLITLARAAVESDDDERGHQAIEIAGAEGCDSSGGGGGGGGGGNPGGGGGGGNPGGGGGGGGGNPGGGGGGGNPGGGGGGNPGGGGGGGNPGGGGGGNPGGGGGGGNPGGGGGGGNPGGGGGGGNPGGGGGGNPGGGGNGVTPAIDRPVSAAVGGRISLPDTATLGRFLARGGNARTLGLGMVAFAFLGTALMALFGSLAMRRREPAFRH